MSAISSDLSSATSQIAQLKQLTQNASGAPHAHRHGGGAKFKQAFTNAAEQAGLDPSKADGLQQQIDDAIKNARSNGTGDNRQSVQQAIDDVLKKNGVDIDKFHDAMKAEFDKARTEHEHNNASAQATTNNEAETSAQNLTPGSVDILG